MHRLAAHAPHTPANVRPYQRMHRITLPPSLQLSKLPAGTAKRSELECWRYILLQLSESCWRVARPPYHTPCALTAPRSWQRNSLSRSGAVTTPRRVVDRSLLEAISLRSFQHTQSWRAQNKVERLNLVRESHWALWAPARLHTFSKHNHGRDFEAFREVLLLTCTCCLGHKKGGLESEAQPLTC